MRWLSMTAIASATARRSGTPTTTQISVTRSETPKSWSAVKSAR